MSISKFLKNVAALLIFGVILLSIIRFKQCLTPIVVPVVQTDTLPSAADTLIAQISALKTENEFLYIALRNSRTAAHTDKTPNRTTITIFDTIHQKVNITDTILNKEVITLYDTINHKYNNYLKLPLTFAMQDTPHIKLSGEIDTANVTITDIELFNRLTLTDTKSKTFWTEKHILSMQQSNPYVRSIVPVYQYQTATRKSQFIEKVAAFAVGAGLGYWKGKN